MVLRSEEEKTPIRKSPGVTMFLATLLPAASPAGPMVAFIGVSNVLLYPTSIPTAATGIMGSFVRVTGTTTCPQGLPEPVPRSTTGFAIAEPAISSMSIVIIVILPSTFFMSLHLFVKMI
jgi:hypothetical protein